MKRKQNVDPFRRVKSPTFQLINGHCLHIPLEIIKSISEWNSNECSIFVKSWVTVQCALCRVLAKRFDFSEIQKVFNRNRLLSGIFKYHNNVLWSSTDTASRLYTLNIFHYFIYTLLWLLNEMQIKHNGNRNQNQKRNETRKKN